jgi:hypothetical protein
VTGIAAVAKLALVWIVFLMAVETNRSGVAVCLVRAMAIAAGNGRVRAMQGEVGEHVIKRRLIKFDDVQVAAFMFGVTRRTFGAPGFGEPAVET